MKINLLLAISTILIIIFISLFVVKEEAKLTKSKCGVDFYGDYTQYEVDRLCDVIEGIE